jgi:hypothetical protein
MRTPLEIRNDALDCLRQAELAQARRHKAVLLILAQGWASLAEEMERRGLAPRAEASSADESHDTTDELGEEADEHSAHLQPVSTN